MGPMTHALVDATQEREPAVSHMVSYRGSDGSQSYHQTDELSDAIGFVEHLRNDEGIDHARIFKLEELSFEFRPVFRVELATELPPPPASAAVAVETETVPGMSAGSEWLSAIAGNGAEEMDPLAAAWTATERTDVAPENGDGVGAGMGRKGLFGR